MTSYFNISPNETVESLKLKSMNHLLMIFEKIIFKIHSNESLPISSEKWLCQPYTKKQLDDLCKINPSIMNNNEILLRIRATDYNNKYDSAFIEVEGKRFSYKSSMNDPIV